MPVNILIMNGLITCMCLSNTYTTYTQVVTLFVFEIMSDIVSTFEYISKSVYMMCMTCVHVRQTYTRP